MTDIEIANKARMYNIKTIAKKINLTDIIMYGNYKAKINSYKANKKGKVILVTATSPTPYGEGKTTVAIGLLDALCKHHKAILSLREPSLGPVFGLKGGACGGGYSQVLPMEDINLHFTGDFHAITEANNLLSAVIDDHISKGNELHIKEVLFKRCLDVNDRELKNITLTNGRCEHFTITAASEIMAILCLSKDIDDLRSRLDNIIIGIDDKDKYIYAKQLNVVGSLLVLLKDAIKPNLVQTLEHNPVIIHGGPFANIATGCSSRIATSLGQQLCDYVITEAGFGSDCGALKYLDIVSNEDMKPNVCVLVTSTKALNHTGLDNLDAHIRILKQLNQNIIVCINKYDNDTENDLNKIINYCKSINIEYSITTCYKDGGKGSIDLANKVVNYSKNEDKDIYNINDTVEDKIESIIKNLYLANEIEYNDLAIKSLNIIKNNNLTNLKICIAKTPYSISDNKNLLGNPSNYKVTVTDIQINNGAGFIVVYLGNILTMPGLSENSNYKNIDYINNNIIGLS